MSDLDLVTVQHAAGGSPASGPPGRPFSGGSPASGPLGRPFWFSFGSHLVQILFRVGCGRSPLVQYSPGCGSYSVFFALFWLSGYLSAFFAQGGHVSCGSDMCQIWISSCPVASGKHGSEGHPVIAQIWFRIALGRKSCPRLSQPHRETTLHFCDPVRGEHKIKTHT